MVQRFEVRIELADGHDVVPLPLGFGTEPIGLFHRRLALLEDLLRRWEPQRIPGAHRNTPVAHCAGWVDLRDLGEGLARLGVEERVHHSHRPVEFFLGGRTAGNGKGNLADSLRRASRDPLVLVGACAESGFSSGFIANTFFTTSRSSVRVRYFFSSCFRSFLYSSSSSNIMAPQFRFHNF